MENFMVSVPEVLQIYRIFAENPLNMSGISGSGRPGLIDLSN